MRGLEKHWYDSRKEYNSRKDHNSRKENLQVQTQEQSYHGKKDREEELRGNQGWFHQNARPSFREKLVFHAKTKSPKKFSEAFSAEQRSIEAKVCQLLKKIIPIYVMIEPEKTSPAAEQIKSFEPSDSSSPSSDQKTFKAHKDIQMTQEEIDNDDLVEENIKSSLERTISDPIRPLNLTKNRSPALSQRRLVKERMEFSKSPVPKTMHRKKRSKMKSKALKSSRDLPGMASKKRNALLADGSPMKRHGASTSKVNGKPSIATRLTFSRNEVLPSTSNKNLTSASGLVGS